MILVVEFVDLKNRNCKDELCEPFCRIVDM